MSNKLKIALTASLLLNLAFVVGFVVKKYLVAQPHHHKEHVSHCRYTPCGEDAKNVGYRHFCKRPGFKKHFHQYQDTYRKAAENLKRTKKAYLIALKKENIDEESLEKLHRDVIRSSNELNEENYKHLLTMKKLLKPGDFTCLVNCMLHALDFHQETPFYVNERFCIENDRKHHPAEKAKGKEKQLETNVE